MPRSVELDAGCRDEAGVLGAGTKVAGGRDAVRLAWRRGMDGVELVGVLSQVVDRVASVELVRVARLRLDVHADDVEPGRYVAGSSATFAAEEVEKSHAARSVSGGEFVCAPTRVGCRVGHRVESAASSRFASSHGCQCAPHAARPCTSTSRTTLHDGAFTLSPNATNSVALTVHSRKRAASGK